MLTRHAAEESKKTLLELSNIVEKLSKGIRYDRHYIDIYDGRNSFLIKIIVDSITFDIKISFRGIVCTYQYGLWLSAKTLNDSMINLITQYNYVYQKYNERIDPTHSWIKSYKPHNLLMPILCSIPNTKNTSLYINDQHAITKEIAYLFMKPNMINIYGSQGEYNMNTLLIIFCINDLAEN